MARHHGLLNVLMRLDIDISQRIDPVTNETYSIGMVILLLPVELFSEEHYRLAPVFHQ